METLKNWLVSACRRRGNPHQVGVQIDFIRTGDRRIALSGMPSDKGGVNKGTLVASSVFFGLTGALIAMNSRRGEIREGAEVKALVAEGISILR